MSDKCGSCKHDGTVRFNTNGTTDCMKCDKKDIHNVGPCTDYRPAVEPEGGGKDVLKVDETIRNCGFAEYQAEHQFTDYEPNQTDYMRGYHDAYKDANHDLTASLRDTQTRLQKFTKCQNDFFDFDYADNCESYNRNRRQLGLKEITLCDSCEARQYLDGQKEKGK